jgi:hypothetical protein
MLFLGLVFQSLELLVYKISDRLEAIFKTIITRTTRTATTRPVPWPAFRRQKGRSRMPRPAGGCNLHVKWHSRLLFMVT